MKRAKKAASEDHSTNIQGCKFTGVEWDKPAIEVLQTVATALLNLTSLFKSQGLKFETMIKVGDTKEKFSIMDSHFDLKA